MMEIDLWWATPIAHDYIDYDYEYLTEKCLEMEKEKKGRVASNVGGWQSGDLTCEEKIPFTGLLNEIHSRVNSIMNSMNMNVEMINCWININRGNNFNHKHIHQHSTMSACVYINVPDGSGNIEFVRNDVICHYIDDFSAPFNSPFGRLNINYTPKVGKVLIFPSWIEHQVLPSTSQEPRISLAINFK